MKLLGLHSLCKHLNFPLSFSNLRLSPSQMALANTPVTETIPTLENSSIYNDNEPSIHVEYFFDIQELEKVGLMFNETLLFCGARHFFNEPQTIYPK